MLPRPLFYCICYILVADYAFCLACAAALEIMFRSKITTFNWTSGFYAMVLLVSFGVVDVVISSRSKAANAAMPVAGLVVGFATHFLEECILWIPVALFYVGIESDAARKTIIMDSFLDSVSSAYAMSKPTSTILAVCFFAVHFYNKLALFVYRDAVIPAAKELSSWFNDVYLKYNKK